MNKSAILSADRKYRYTLSRVWDITKPTMNFIGLNPSTADENNDDPTIRRCIQFAKDWGYGSFTMLNLFAYRATLPTDLKRAPEPIGAENDIWIAEITREIFTVAAWGNHGTFMNRSYDVAMKTLNLHVLGLTKLGQPKHPLYLKSDTKPVLWRGYERS